MPVRHGATDDGSRREEEEGEESSQNQGVMEPLLRPTTVQTVGEVSV